MKNPPTTDRGTLFDLPFETARERISGLQASASPGAGSHATTLVSGRPPMRRLRTAVGSRLIEVGRILVADDPARRSVSRT